METFKWSTKIKPSNHIKNKDKLMKHSDNHIIQRRKSYTENIKQKFY